MSIAYSPFQSRVYIFGAETLYQPQRTDTHTHKRIHLRLAHPSSSFVSRTFDVARTTASDRTKKNESANSQRCVPALNLDASCSEPFYIIRNSGERVIYIYIHVAAFSRKFDFLAMLLSQRRLSFAITWLTLRWILTLRAIEHCH